MGFITYLPRLLFLGQQMCNFIRRYEPQIRTGIGSENGVLLDAVLVACDALDVALKAIIPPPT